MLTLSFCAAGDGFRLIFELWVTACYNVRRMASCDLGVYQALLSQCFGYFHVLEVVSKTLPKMEVGKYQESTYTAVDEDGD